MIYIVTLNNGYFGSAGQNWLSIDVNILKGELLSVGLSAEIIRFSDIENITFHRDDFVIYTSSEDASIRGYIKDVMFFVSKKCTIIPSYENLLAHENKGFQHLSRQEKKFGNLKGCYLYDIDDLDYDKPVVLKKTTGAGSSGVSLIRSGTEIIKLKRKFKNRSVVRAIKNIIRKFQLSSDQFNFYYYRYKGFLPFVTQEFVSGLNCDFKVLIFGEKFYVLKRYVRKDDFKASGSGQFSFEEASPELLNYAQTIFEILDTPIASLDIVENNKGYALIEYQTTNFGPIALKRSRGFYRKKESDWVFINSESNLDKEFSTALSNYIRNII
ncbi:TPA: hypothetical protein RQJ67_004218 [Vibrio vulnificus]|nr:hypothetical protein [Vibrio vulnificus]HDY7535614.1 hypothetical protein [Vibrio vulnificus]HDY8076100.1 hypothetical protein [Vibrio vulnificus]